MRKIRTVDMKYILMMTGSAAGVESYQAWSDADKQAHMSVLRGICKDLTKSGQFVATEGLAAPGEARVVRGQRDGLPVTDGVFPESKEFLVGYWLVEVETPEQAYAIAGRISSAPGPDGVPTNMPIEVRQIISPNA